MKQGNLKPLEIDGEARETQLGNLKLLEIHGEPWKYNWEVLPKAWAALAGGSTSSWDCPSVTSTRM